jgi:NADP-dependent 3-hydroxy acid dehydrogenase YdfG
MDVARRLQRQKDIGKQLKEEYYMHGSHVFITAKQFEREQNAASAIPRSSVALDIDMEARQTLEKIEL